MVFDVIMPIGKLMVNAWSIAFQNTVYQDAHKLVVVIGYDERTPMVVNLPLDRLDFLHGNAVKLLDQL